MTATIGESHLRRLRVLLADGEIALLRFGRAGAPPLLFGHANGFCASAYRQMFEALGDRFDIFAVDLRGHGRSTLATDCANHRSADIFGRDMGALLSALRDGLAAGTKWTLSGHSLGAVAVTLAAVGRSDIAALQLIEPVAMPRLWYAFAHTPMWPFLSRQTPLVKGAMKRRGEWPSADAVAESYRRKAIFSTWAPNVLGDYLSDGLAPTPVGVKLSCTPAWEAATFAAQAHDIWKAAAAVNAPIRILAARHPTSTVSPDALRRYQALGVEVVMVDDATHLYPFEDPEGAARFLAAP